MHGPQVRSVADASPALRCRIQPHLELPLAHALEAQHNVPPVAKHTVIENYDHATGRSLHTRNRMCFSLQ